MATTFLDGPAGGVTLELARFPIWLRVVIDRQGKVDALDQLDDEPEPGEVIHVYKRDGEPSVAIACSRGRGGGCRRFAMAAYNYHSSPEGLDDAEVWRQWVQWEHQKEQRNVDRTSPGDRDDQTSA